VTDSQREHCIEEGMREVAIVSRMYVRGKSHVELDDIRQDGMVGMLQALVKFDPRRGTKFASFANRRVSGSILDGARRTDVLERNHRKRVRAGIDRSPSFIHLDDSDHTVDLPVASSAHQIELQIDLRAAVARLPRLLRRVVTMYYFDDMPMHEIARVLGVCNSWVSQLLLEARLRLKEILEARQTR